MLNEQETVYSVLPKYMYILMCNKNPSEAYI